MIIPQSRSFFIIEGAGEAVSILTRELSPENARHIKEISLISTSFNTDIEAQLAANSFIDHFVNSTSPNTEIKTELNPLYLPGEIPADVFSEGTNKNTLVFSSVDGNPFTQSVIEISSGGNRVIKCTTRYENYDLPPYEDLVSNVTYIN